MTILTCAKTTSQVHDLSQILSEVEAIVSPFWPLNDYVAVNPFVGLAHHQFLDARQYLRALRDCELLLPCSYFRHQFQKGTMTHSDIEEAFRQMVQEYPDLHGTVGLDELCRLVDDPEESNLEDERRFRTVAEIIDRRQGSSWTSHILNDITRHCASHYDEGQALWPSPWKGVPLYQAWRESSQISTRMDQLGISGFRRLAAQLPESPEDAISQLLSLLRIPGHYCKLFLLCELFSVSGWASYVKYHGTKLRRSDRDDDDLMGLLAIRLAYDAALAEAHDQDGRISLELFPGESISSHVTDDAATPISKEILARHLFQVAMEVAYRRKLCGILTSRRSHPCRNNRRALQMVFCIDVRSEVLRRHLESLSVDIETFGFAGFFGMAFEYISLGRGTGSAQCPVLLQPSFRVPERVHGADEAVHTKAIRDRRTWRAACKLWKSFQTSAASCFTFVESLGMVYLIKILTDAIRLTRPVISAGWDGLPPHHTDSLGLELHSPDHDELTDAHKLDLAEGFLRNLGLCSDFARLVVICGHATDVVNNPYKASLDCGACGGHSGEPNARVAAALLNDRQVRLGLTQRGIQIPDDTWFIPAVHNTTTDEVRMLDTEAIPETHRQECHQTVQWLQEASERTRGERMRRFGDAVPTDAYRRGIDWAELRPEWGLAGNAALLIAPRLRTAGLDLGGRTFLHSYDSSQDVHGETLELIMTAPMIVASWINLQYYASAVDNRAFGSGNKAIHNVVGLMGVLQGNGGDLMTGLPWQCLHDGARFQHEPLRLLVVVEAPREAVQRIIYRHQHVHDLVANGWLTLVVLENDQFHRWNSDGQFVPCD